MSVATHRLSACQVNPVLGDLAHNFDQHLQMAEEAADEGAELALFPELSLTGYALKDMVFEVALKKEDSFFAPLLALSRRIDICFGFVEQSDSYLYYNSCAYLSEGQIVHVHRKVFLPTYGLMEEKRFFARGENIRAFDTPRLGRIGLMICNDWWHSAGSMVLAQDGATLLLAPANSPSRGMSGSGQAWNFGPDVRVHNDNARVWYGLMSFHAKTSSTPILFCNRTGFDDGIGFWGGSSWWGPNGIGLKALEQKAGILSVDYFPDDVRRERIYSPLLRDEELGLMIRELERVRRRRNEGLL